MSSHRHNPEKKEWKGRSYRKGGEWIRDLREKETVPTAPFNYDPQDDVVPELLADPELRRLWDAEGDALKEVAQVHRILDKVEAKRQVATQAFKEYREAKKLKKLARQEEDKKAEEVRKIFERT